MQKQWTNERGQRAFPPKLALEASLGCSGSLIGEEVLLEGACFPAYLYSAYILSTEAEVYSI